MLFAFCYSEAKLLNRELAVELERQKEIAEDAKEMTMDTVGYACITFFSIRAPDCCVTGLQTSDYCCLLAHLIACICVNCPTFTTASKHAATLARICLIAHGAYSDRLEERDLMQRIVTLRNVFLVCV